MAGCEITDVKCFFVNEIAGDPIIAAIGMIIVYFILASKLKFGFDTTIYAGFPIALIIGLTFAGFPVIYAFLTVLAAIMIAYVFQRMIGNR